MSTGDIRQNMLSTAGDETLRFAYDVETVRPMCNKETNTDYRLHFDRPLPAGSRLPKSTVSMASNSQPRQDGLHGSSIRRWQTFSPPGVVEEQHECRVGAAA